MCELSYLDKIGLKDFFDFQEYDVVIKLAKTLTKNVVSVNSAKDAFEIIYQHSKSALIVLSKRTITKEMMFKYLHHNGVSLQADFTKTSLIEEVQKLWKQKYNYSEETESLPDLTMNLVNEENFPIHLLSKNFSEWFYDNYNKDKLKSIDLWLDSKFDLKIQSNNGSETEQVYTSELIVDCLRNTRNKFNLYFNPNLNHNGVQGRMDPHGMVCVLSCGTLHNQTQFVGLFESTFGLLRDPSSDNNWKIKVLKMFLRSHETETSACLEESESLIAALALPAPSGPLT